MIYVDFQKYANRKDHILTGNGLLHTFGLADRRVLLTDIGRRIVEDIDRGVVISKDNISIPRYDTSIPPSELSGGTQSLIYLLSSPIKPIRLECFGENCFKYIWEISNIVDYDINFISTGYGCHIFDDAPKGSEFVCSNDGSVIRDKFTFRDKRREFVKYEWENYE